MGKIKKTGTAVIAGALIGSGMLLAPPKTVEVYPVVQERMVSPIIARSSVVVPGGQIITAVIVKGKITPLDTMNVPEAGKQVLISTHRIVSSK